jgi:hypothetical protein
MEIEVHVANMIKPKNHKLRRETKKQNSRAQKNHHHTSRPFFAASEFKERKK